MDSSFHDPEGIYYLLRNLVHVGETDLAMQKLDEIVHAGFHCDTILRIDPWLEPVHDTPAYKASLAYATVQRTEAEQAVRRRRRPLATRPPPSPSTR